MQRLHAAPAAPCGDHAAAIVVLGARIGNDGRPSRALERRMQAAIALYHAGAAPLLLLSGGGKHTVPEAEVMRRLALAGGVPEAALLIEPKSRNTVENATQTAQLLAPRGIAAIILVTDPYHALRARLLFRLAGLAVRAVHVAPMPLRRQWTMLVAESLKLPFSVARALVRNAIRPRRG
jgi:uncharacterized SAM-binding protein YcdF (DUF218 family)